MRATLSLKKAIPLGLRSVAWVTDSPGAGFKLRPIRLDEVRDDEVLVEMKYSGICHTDVAVSRGLLNMTEFPAIFGHEGAGIVRAVGEGVKDKSLRPGDSVMLSYSTCQTCPACVSGQRYFCHLHPEVNHNAVRLSDRTTPTSLDDGTPVRSQYFGHSSFAKHSVVHEDTIVKCEYPDQLKRYAPLGCGFQTGAGAVLNVVKPGINDQVAIFGLGTVGLAAIMAAKFMGVKNLIAVDLNRIRLNLAAELGATHLIDAKSSTNVPKAIRDITGPGGANHAIECTGVTQVIEECVRSVGAQGSVVSLGVPKPGALASIEALDFLLHNKTYRGIIQGAANPAQFIPLMIDLHQRGHFPLEKICVEYSAMQINEAIDDMESGKVIKPVLSWDDVDPNAAETL